MRCIWKPIGLQVLAVSCGMSYDIYSLSQFLGDVSIQSFRYVRMNLGGVVVEYIRSSSVPGMFVLDLRNSLTTIDCGKQPYSNFGEDQRTVLCGTKRRAKPVENDKKIHMASSAVTQKGFWSL